VSYAVFDADISIYYRAKTRCSSGALLTATV